MDTHRYVDRWGKTFLPIFDALAILLAFTAAYSIRIVNPKLESVFSPLTALFIIFNLLCLYLFGLYHFDARPPRWKKVAQAAEAIFLAGCINVIITFLSGAITFTGLVGRGVLIGAHVAFALWVIGSRLALLNLIRHSGRKTRYLVLGTEENLRAFVVDLKTSELVGSFALLNEDGQPLDFINTTQNFGSARTPLTVCHQGAWSDLEKLSNEPWTSIIVCSGPRISDDLVEILMDIRLRGTSVIDLTDFYEQTWLKVPVYYLQKSWFAMTQGFQLLHNPIGLKLKRIFDFIGAFVLLVLTAPLMALTAVAIKLESSGPLIFKQKRVGEGGKVFTVYKLRSMRNDAEKNGAQWASVKDSRVTKVGTFIRATRIDELPQLYNVLRGEMSFVGPRPERPEFTDKLDEAIPFYNLRHVLKPGVTGWAQVMYPYGASIEDAREKLQYELYYIKNYSLLLDTLIVLKTVRVVLFGKGR